MLLTVLLKNEAGTGEVSVSTSPCGASVAEAWLCLEEFWQ